MDDPSRQSEHSATTTTVASPSPLPEMREKNASAKPERPAATVTTHSADPGSTYTMYEACPPPLNYSVKENKREGKILLWFTLLFVEAGVLPLILFFSLRWGAHLSITKNLAIITSLIGSVSGYKFASRMWALWYAVDAANSRPIGAGRWGVDYFQFIVSLTMAAFFIPLIIGSSVSPANPRIVALALPAVMLTLTLPLLITGLLPHAIRLPVRVSSFPKNEPLPPLTYCFVEDVVAVDGGGLTEFRQAWRTRYEESIVIRRVIRYTALLWGLSGTIVAAGLIVAAWLASVDTAYGVCYGVPWLWAMVTAAATGAWTHQELAREYREWGRAEGTRDAGPVHKEHILPIREGRFDPPRVSGSMDGGRPDRRYSTPGRPERAGPQSPQPIDRRAQTFEV